MRSVTDSCRSPAPGCVLFCRVGGGCRWVEVAVDGFAGNAEGVGDLGDGVAVFAVRGYLGVHAVGDVDLSGGELRPASADTAAGGFQALPGALADQVGEHLVHRGEHVEGEPKSPVVKTWLAAHPRFQMHFTPTYSSWLNQVERFFAFVTEDLLQRSHHDSVQQLEADIRGWVKDWNTHPKPFIWTKDADEILESLGRLLQRISGAGH